MTRINCIPVEALNDKHLLAEYKEITRPFNKMIKRIEKYGVEDALNNCVIPANYTLNTGHESFFFNKLRWLYYRYDAINRELVKRDFNVDEIKFGRICTIFVTKLWDTPYWNYWEPSHEDMYLNMARLVKRSNLDSVKEELLSDN